MSSAATSKIKKRAKRAKTPRHAVATRAYRFLLDLTPAQETLLHDALFACWRLRNRLALDRSENRRAVKAARAAGEQRGYLTRADQYGAIKAFAKQDAAWGALHSQVAQNVAVRLDEGYQRFFEALKEGRSGVHPPRLRRFAGYHSFTFPQYGTAARIRGGRLHLSRLGDFRLNAYRKIRGRKKTVTIKRAQGRWWCIVTAEVFVRDLHPALPVAADKPDAGVDTGLAALLTDSHGHEYDPPKAWHLLRGQLATAQKKLARRFDTHLLRYCAHVVACSGLGLVPLHYRRFPRSGRLQRQLAVVRDLHARIANLRDHHQKKNAAILADRYHRVAVEEHGVGFMIRNRRLAKLASDRAIHKQKLLLQSKLGPRYIGVPNRRPGLGGNSQTCVCGAPVPKPLAERVHRCPACGLVAPRDEVAANIAQQIAFGTCVLERRGAGCPSSDVEGPKAGSAKAARTESARTSEAPAKRRPQAKRCRENTAGGEPAAEGKTSGIGRSVAVAACAETLG